MEVRYGNSKPTKLGQYPINTERYERSQPHYAEQLMADLIDSGRDFSVSVTRSEILVSYPGPMV